MPDDTVIIFKPKLLDLDFNMRGYTPTHMLERIAEQYPELLKDQIRIFPYVMGAEIFDSVHRYTGFVYTRGENDNPLTKFNDTQFMKGMDGLVMKLGAIVSANCFKGRVEVAHPNEQDYINVLEMGLLSQFEDVGMPRPEEVRRFILDLDTETFIKVVQPYLDHHNYNRIQRKTVF